MTFSTAVTLTLRTIGKSGKSFNAIPLALTIALLFSGSAVSASLEQILDRGTIEVAAYRHFPPFSYKQDGKRAGIDLDIAKLIADKLEVGLTVRLIAVDENMSDDLRNNIWKGHYIGGGIADFMMHVPYDLAFAAENDMVRFLAPYFRETLSYGVNPDTAGSVRDVSDIDQHKIGVELDTLADFYLLSPRHGNKRANVVHFNNLSEAVVAYKAGEIDIVAGPTAEIEGVLNNAAAEYDLRPMPTPGLRATGWDVGIGIKANNDALIAKLLEIMRELKDSGEIKKIFERNSVQYLKPSDSALSSGYSLE